MEVEYKITEANPSERAITLLLDGKFSEDAIPALEHSICEARSRDRTVYLDLSEVTLVDRKAVQYFCRQAEEDVRLVNCPAYLRRWIGRVGQDVES